MRLTIKGGLHFLFLYCIERYGWRSVFLNLRFVDQIILSPSILFSITCTSVTGWIMIKKAVVEVQASLIRETSKGRHIIDYWKKETRTLRTIENINYTNDDVMKYVIGALQWKLPRTPQPFNPALTVPIMESDVRVLMHTSLKYWKKIYHCYVTINMKAFPPFQP